MSAMSETGSTLTEIRQMREQINELQGLVRTLDRRDNERSNELVSMQTRVGSGAKFKVGTIEKFDGDRKKLRNFLTDVRVHQALERVLNEKDKTMFAVTHLTGNPRAYFEPFVREYSEKPEEDWGPITRGIFNNYRNFEKLIESAFGNVDMAKEAAQKIVELRQEGSATKHATRFLHLKSHLDWDENAMMQLFEQSLKPEIRRGLLYAASSDSLLSLIDKAVKIDNAEYEIRKRRTGQGPTVKRNQEKPDVIMTGAVDLKKAKKDGLCFFCGKKGHMARKCFKKKKMAEDAKGSGEKKTETAALRISIAAANIGRRRDASPTSEGSTAVDNEENQTEEAADYLLNLLGDITTEIEQSRLRLTAVEEAYELATRTATLEGTDQEIEEFQDAQEEQEEFEEDLEGLEEWWTREESQLAEAEAREEVPETPEAITQSEPPEDETRIDWNCTSLRDSAERHPGRRQRRQERRRERQRLQDRNSECTCGRWWRKCYEHSQRGIAHHREYCDNCNTWLKSCKRHSAEEKIEKLEETERTRYAPWLEERYLGVGRIPYTNRWQCDATRTYYTCFKSLCNEHLAEKHEKHISPEVPAIVVQNARTCPCLRLGCVCQEETNHELHWTSFGKHCKNPNSCWEHGEDERREWQRIMGPKPVERWRDLRGEGNRESTPAHSLFWESIGTAVFNDDQHPVDVERIYIEIKIAGERKCAMIDTGAVRSLIGKHVIKGAEDFPTTQMTCSDYAGNETVKEIQLIRGFYEMGPRKLQDWFVIQEFKTESLGYDIILGIDWCRKYDVTIRCATGEITCSFKDHQGQIKRTSVATVTVANIEGIERNLPSEEIQETKIVRFEEPARSRKKSLKKKKKSSIDSDTK
jgi:Ty3 transposon capsid-like protein/Zinc knuckle